MRTIEQKMNTSPIKIEVEFHPETGAKRPFEIWNTYASGRKIRRGSFKTKEAADAACAVRNKFWAEYQK